MLSRHVTLLDGEKVFIRPLTPEDAPLYADYQSEITTDDLRLRFFAPMRAMSDELIDKLVHYDPETAMAFVAIDKDGRLLGVVRLHGGPGGKTAEFAILLRSRLKGHGLGWQMMKHMIAYAKEKGLTHVRGQVLDENKNMLQMCKELGFEAHHDPVERGVKVVDLTLDRVPAEAVA